ncbi:MAG: 1-deoxy-D-xylulose-5-phosphate synthase [Clostridia bacterium]
MSMLLEQIQNTEDVKKLSIEEKNKLAQEIRELVIQTVSKTGGHLASNLGVVELTIALHSIFDVPKDKIIWDVGHQTYVHKILTGRKEQLKTLRQLHGIAGFPKTCESEADCFNTGHSSTSISVALGMARARDIKKEKNHVVAVIGDGALTGGMALEALNDAGCSGTDITVILNDNEMSISKNVGGISLFLSNLRTKKWYTKSNSYFKSMIRKIPGFGDFVVKSVRRLKSGVKQLLMPTMLFEDLGFRYLGPVDGHNIEQLESLLRISKTLEGPVLIHVITKKGKGYRPAEQNPDKFHSTSSFDIATGKAKKEKGADYSSVMGNVLVRLAKEDKRIVAITAAMKDGTGLTKFSKEYPDRFFDVGIAEQHAVGLAAGLAKAGLKPVVPIYSSFYQRAYDQVIHDIAIQKLPVILCVDRAGIVGNDGETHQGIFDLSFFSIVPNLTIMAPKNFKELEEMLAFAVKQDSPMVIRYPRGGEEKEKIEKQERIQLGKAEILKEGKDITIVAIGNMVPRCITVAKKLEEKGISIEVINARFLKPLDEDTIEASVLKTRHLLTIEDNIRKGGLATQVMELLEKKEHLKDIKAVHLGYPDTFITHGKVEQLEKMYGLDQENIEKQITELLER